MQYTSMLTVVENKILYKAYNLHTYTISINQPDLFTTPELAHSKCIRATHTSTRISCL